MSYTIPEQVITRAVTKDWYVFDSEVPRDDAYLRTLVMIRTTFGSPQEVLNAKRYLNHCEPSELPFITQLISSFQLGHFLESLSSYAHNLYMDKSEVLACLDQFRMAPTSALSSTDKAYTYYSNMSFKWVTEMHGMLAALFNSKQLIGYMKPEEVAHLDLLFQSIVSTWSKEEIYAQLSAMKGLCMAWVGMNVMISKSTDRMAIVQRNVLLNSFDIITDLVECIFELCSYHTSTPIVASPIYADASGESSGYLSHIEDETIVH